MPAGLSHLAPGYSLEVLDANRHILEAEERLKAGGVEDDDLYDLVLLATGDAEIAESALYARMRMRALNSPTVNTDGE